MHTNKHKSRHPGFRSNEQKGATLIEYALLLGLIGTVSIAAVVTTGTEVASVFSQSSDTISTQVTQRAENQAAGGGGTGGGGPTPAAWVTQAECDQGYTGNVLGDIHPDIDNDNAWTFAFRRFTGGHFYDQLNFGVSYEQEYYGEFTGVDSFDRYRYDQTVIYPPNWNPCVDDQGYPEPHR